MSDGFAYLDILFFAMVAAFIAFRLRGVLGRKTGNERPRVDPISQRAAARGGDNVVPMPERAPAGAGRRASPSRPTRRSTRLGPASPTSSAPIRDSTRTSSCRAPGPRSR